MVQRAEFRVTCGDAYSLLHVQVLAVLLRYARHIALLPVQSAFASKSTVRGRPIYLVSAMTMHMVDLLRSYFVAGIVISSTNHSADLVYL